MSRKCFLYVQYQNTPSLLHLFVPNTTLLTFQFRYVYNSNSVQWKLVIYLNRHKLQWQEWVKCRTFKLFFLLELQIFTLPHYGKVRKITEVTRSMLDLKRQRKTWYFLHRVLKAKSILLHLRDFLNIWITMNIPQIYLCIDIFN